MTALYCILPPKYTMYACLALGIASGRNAHRKHYEKVIWNSPVGAVSHSCRLHFWVFAGVGSWSHWASASCSSSAFVLTHLTRRRWTPPPQDAEHYEHTITQSRKTHRFCKECSYKDEPTNRAKSPLMEVFLSAITVPATVIIIPVHGSWLEECLLLIESHVSCFDGRP